MMPPDYRPPLLFRVQAELAGNVLLHATGPASVVIAALAEVLATVPNLPDIREMLFVSVVAA